MGISGLLPRILPSAGRENYDLRALSDGVITMTARRGADDDDDYGRDRDDDHDDDGEGGDGGEEEEEEPAKKKRRRSPSSTSTSASTTTWTRRRVRVGVDASGWIARAAHGHGGLLMDERHLSYRGRAELRDERARSSRQEGGVANEGDGGGDDGDGERRPTDEVERESTRRRLEYVAACTLTVLRKIEYLVDDCRASVLLVLDGATPPCKRDVVRARSDRRADAAEERDGEEGGGEAPGGGGGDDGDDGDDEAARTEAEVLRRISASNRAGTGKDHALRREMVEALLGACRERRWPCVVAPYEADGQLAYLAGPCGAVDVVVTEDSDLIALGVPTLIYRLGGWNGTNGANRQQRFLPGRNDEDDDGDDHRRLLGTMLRRSDLGSSRGIDLRDFTDGMLVVMFVAAGCDYCDSLRGIGIVKARDVVRRAYLGQEDADGNYRRGPSSHRRGDDWDDDGDVPVLRVVLDELFRSCHKVARERLLPLDDPETEVARSAYERAFLAALAAFRHPLVYDPISMSHVVANDVCDDDGTAAPSFPASPLFVGDERILMEYGPYRDLVTDRDALYRAIGSPLTPGLAKDVAEGRVDPRRLPPPPREEEYGGIDDAPGIAAMRGVGNVAAAMLGYDRDDDDDDDDDDDGDEGAGSGEFTQDGDSGLQLSTQESQRSARSSSGMMSSSLSPDLLASPSPQEQS